MCQLHKTKQKSPNGPTELVKAASGLLQLPASFLNHPALESLGGSSHGLSNASGVPRDREGQPTEGGERRATSSFWAWDLQKLVTGHAPPAQAVTCTLLSSLHPLVSFSSIYFSISTHWTQTELGAPSCLWRVTETWDREMTHPRSNYCFPWLGEGCMSPGRMRRGYRNVGQMCNSLGS